MSAFLPNSADISKTMHEVSRPLVSIGWVLATDVRDEDLLRIYSETRQWLRAVLAAQFPAFRWEMPFVHRRRYAAQGALDPLPLLELGVQEKLQHNWDYALVVVPNELEPEHRTLIIGVPSSALEVAVLTSALAEDPSDTCDRLAGLAAHLLGHLWGLEHAAQGPMIPPENIDDLVLLPFPTEQWGQVEQRLEDVADARLEEQNSNRSLFWFYVRTFWADPRGILTDIWGYAPWRFPFRMPRLTGAAAISIVVLLLGAESWEVGTNFPAVPLSLSAIVAILGATIFLFVGQNVGQVSRSFGPREQLMRTRIVVFCAILIGMLALWIVLFGVSYLVASIVPPDVPAGWLGDPLDAQDLGRYAAFMATIGVLGGALGGNLEEEEAIKSELFYDEET